MYATSRRNSAASLTALAALLTAAPISGQIALVYKFTQGEQLRYTHTVKRTQKHTSQEKRYTATTDDVFSITLDVLKTMQNGSAQLAVSIPRITHNRSSHEGFEKYDSQKTQGDPAGIGLELLANAKFSIVIDPKGAISDIKPNEETQKYWNDQPRELRSITNEDALRALLPFIPLPKAAARRGVAWEHKLKVDDGRLGVRDLSVTFAYAGPKTLQGRPLEDVKIKAEPTIADKQRAKYEIVVSSLYGDVLFDPAAGNVKWLEFHEEYDFNPPGAHHFDHKAEERKKEEEKKKEADEGEKPKPKGPKVKKPPKTGKGKKTKEQREKEEEEEKAKPVDKGIEVKLDTTNKLEYRGTPLPPDAAQ